MQYKTIMLELLEQYPKLHSQLKQHRQLLATMETMARELKAHHERIIGELTERQTDGESSGISSQAMELAIAEMQERLAVLSNREEGETLTLDQIMELVIQHSLPE